MTSAKQGDTVKVHYTGKLEDGAVFDSSFQREPIEFRIGGMQIIPGFEQAVVGMKIGDKKTVKLDSESAYGPHLEELVSDVDRTQFPTDIKAEVGLRLEINPPGGPPLLLTIVQVTDDKVTLDANHPLAGKDLIFEIQLLEIKNS